MITFRQIVCPIDFSDNSARALACAAAFARWYEAHLTVLHVTTALEDDTPGARDEVIARIRRFVEQAGAADLKVRPLLQVGIATELIVNFAAGLKADLLVMGTHGLGGFHRLVLGSVTEKVVRTATCPVLTVPPSTPPTAVQSVAFKKILCPIDYSPSSLRALEYALELGRQSDGCVTVLSAVEYTEPEDSLQHLDLDIRDNRQKILDHARERLHAQLAGEPRTWCEIEEVVELNRAYKEILQRASASQMDLIVMGAQGRGGIELLLYGSNTHHVVRAASCPVLVVRA